MKPIYILLILIILVILYQVYTTTNETKNKFDPIIKKPIIKKSILKKPIIETFESIEYYPINFTLPETMTYVPDDCLPLNLAYNLNNQTITLNGSGQIVATDTSLNSIDNTTPIILDLVLLKKDRENILITVSNIKFSVSQCNGNPSLTITNINNESTNLIPKVSNESATTNELFDNSSSSTLLYDSVKGSITIGFVTIPITPLVFLNSPTLVTIFNENPYNKNNNFVLPKICSSQSCILTPSLTNLSPIITVPLNSIDDLVQNKKLFALTANIKSRGIPSEKFNDTNTYKVYLTSALSSDGTFGSCNLANGMFKFTKNLTQGSIFNASSTIKTIPLLKDPYKYIDFYNIISSNTSSDKIGQSIFYNLSLNYNNYSLSYCLRNCDESNPSGLCSQDMIKNSVGQASSNLETNIIVDKYELKNYMKFKFESDGSVTPYFISLTNDVEKIYFITNKFNSIDDPTAFKVPVQVPVYGTEGPYFQIPEVIVQNSMNFTTTKKLPVDGLNTMYTDEEISKFNESATIKPEETKAFTNDAYNNYSIKFTVEEIDPNVINISKLPLNES